MQPSSRSTETLGPVLLSIQRSASKAKIHNIPISRYRDIRRSPLNGFRLEMERRNKNFQRFQPAAPVWGSASGSLWLWEGWKGKGRRNRSAVVGRTLKQLPMVPNPSKCCSVGSNQKNCASVLRLLMSCKCCWLRLHSSGLLLHLQLCLTLR